MNNFKTISDITAQLITFKDGVFTMKLNADMMDDLWEIMLDASQYHRGLAEEWAKDDNAISDHQARYHQRCYNNLQELADNISTIMANKIRQ